MSVVEIPKQAVGAPGSTQESLTWRLTRLLEEFYDHNLVVTVALESYTPPAMGNYKTVVDVRPARGSY